MNENAMQTASMDPFINAILLMGVGTITVLWVMYAMKLGRSPPGYPGFFLGGFATGRLVTNQQ